MVVEVVVAPHDDVVEAVGLGIVAPPHIPGRREERLVTAPPHAAKAIIGGMFGAASSKRWAPLTDQLDDELD